jgi:hypothetical protein
MKETILRLTNVRQESKAKKMFWFFRPKIVITWEPYDLYLTFRNDGDDEFCGGKCTFAICEKTAHDNYEVNIPPIRPNETKTVVKKDLKIKEAGYVELRDLEVESVELESIDCCTLDGTNTLSEDFYYPLSVSSREELYQKYAVVTAFIFFILTFILTIVNVLISIFFK